MSQEKLKFKTPLKVEKLQLTSDQWALSSHYSHLHPFLFIVALNIQRPLKHYEAKHSMCWPFDNLRAE